MLCPSQVFLQAGSGGGRAVAFQAQILLVVAFAAPLVARFIAATCVDLGGAVLHVPAAELEVDAGLSGEPAGGPKLRRLAILAVDAIALCSCAVALYKLVSLSSSTMGSGSPEHGTTTERRFISPEAALSSQQLKLMGGRGDTSRGPAAASPGVGSHGRSIGGGGAGRPPPHSPASAAGGAAGTHLRHRLRGEGGAETVDATDASAPRRRFGGGGSAASGGEWGQSPVFVGLGPLTPRDDGRNGETHWGAPVMSGRSGGAFGSGGDAYRASADRTSPMGRSPSPGAALGGPRVDSEADVEEHIASLGSAIDDAFAEDAATTAQDGRLHVGFGGDLGVSAGGSPWAGYQNAYGTPSPTLGGGDGPYSGPTPASYGGQTPRSGGFAYPGGHPSASLRGSSPSPMGSASPVGAYQFRPSPPPRSRASPRGGGGGPDASRLSPASCDSGAVFAALDGQDRAPPVEVWTDRLREWFAFRLLHPLAAALQRSDAAVMEALEALGETSVRVAPLVGNARDGAAYAFSGAAMLGGNLGGNPGMGVGAPGGHSGLTGSADMNRAAAAAGAQMDGSQDSESLMLEQVRARLEHLVTQATSVTPVASGFGSGLVGGGGLFGGVGGGFGAPTSKPQQHEQQRERERLLKSALEAVVTHLRLMALLRGELPKGLLAAVPPGYMSKRILELAEGTCVANFSYASGGEWAGEPWSRELPDDSQLLCYLFCAFLEVPGWVFAADGRATTGGSSGGMPAAATAGRGGSARLYFAQAPPPHVERYSAVLTSRPPGSVGEGACTVVMPSSVPPVFIVVTAGDVSHAFGGHGGMFRALVLMLLHAYKKNEGSLGATRMGAAAVALDSIFNTPGKVL